MKIERFVDLANWGFNVPLFVVNANKNYGKDTYSAMKEVFGRKRRIDIFLSKDEEKDKTILNLSLNTAVLDINTFEGNGYSSIMFENIPADFSGVVVFNSEIGGCFYHFDRDQGVSRHPFNYLADIDDSKFRHIVRVLHRIKEKLGSVSVSIDYVWAQDFSGVNGSRLIVYDYEIL